LYSQRYTIENVTPDGIKSQYFDATLQNLTELKVVSIVFIYVQPLKSFKRLLDLRIEGDNAKNRQDIPTIGALNDESDFMNMNYRFVFCTEIIIKT
jgi:hypothetical protein